MKKEKEKKEKKVASLLETSIELMRPLDGRYL
jgi:hypothetical protein